MCLSYIPFFRLTTSKVQMITKINIREIKLTNCLSEGNEKRDKFLFNLQKAICLSESSDDNEWLLKYLIYVQNISSLVQIGCEKDQDFVKRNPLKFKLFISQMIIDLLPAIQLTIDCNERISIIDEFFILLNRTPSEDCKNLILEQYNVTFKHDNPKVLCDILKSSTEHVNSLPDLLTITEPILENYFTKNGKF